MIRQPEVSGYGVLDTGATETVAGLGALEYIMVNRKRAGIDLLNFEVVNCPNKTFKFGNGMSQQSESMVLLPQRLGTHLLSLGIFTLEAEGVPVLVGIRTLSRLGALIDCSRSAMILSAIDPTLLVPLKQSSSGHLLLDLTHDWLADGSKIMFADARVSFVPEQYGAAAAESCYMVGESQTPGDVPIEGDQVHSFPFQRQPSASFAVDMLQVMSQEERKLMETLPQEHVMSFLSDVFAVRVNHEHEHGTSSSSTPSAQDQEMSLRLLALLANSHVVSSSVTAHADCGAESSFQCRPGRQTIQSSIEELPRQVRRDSSCRSRSSRSKDNRSPLQWQPPSSTGRQGIGDGSEWLRSMDRLRSVQAQTAFGATGLSRSAGPLPSDTEKMTNELGVEAPYNPLMRTQAIALTGAEKSLEEQLERIRARKEAAGYNKQHQMPVVPPVKGSPPHPGVQGSHVPKALQPAPTYAAQLADPEDLPNHSSRKTRKAASVEVPDSGDEKHPESPQSWEMTKS